MNSKFSVSAWETVSKGGLLVGLKPDEITKLLEAYNYIYRANDLNERILDSIMGVTSALSGVAQTRQALTIELQNTLTALEPMLKDLDKPE